MIQGKAGTSIILDIEDANGKKYKLSLSKYQNKYVKQCSRVLFPPHLSDKIKSFKTVAKVMDSTEKHSVYGNYRGIHIVGGSVWNIYRHGYLQLHTEKSNIPSEQIA